MIETITMGSKPMMCDVVVQGDEYISSLHCCVTRVSDPPGPGRIWVEDFGSTNGTWVNGHRIYGQTELLIGDRLKIGHTEREIPAYAFFVWARR